MSLDTVIAERSPWPPERDEMPDEDDPAAVRAWAPWPRSGMRFAQWCSRRWSSTSASSRRWRTKPTERTATTARRCLTTAAGASTRDPSAPACGGTSWSCQDPFTDDSITVEAAALEADLVGRDAADGGREARDVGRGWPRPRSPPVRSRRVLGRDGLRFEPTSRRRVPGDNDDSTKDETRVFSGLGWLTEHPVIGPHGPRAPHGQGLADLEGGREVAEVADPR